MGTTTQAELDADALMAACRRACRVCKRGRPRGEEEDVAREILSELWNRHGADLGGMTREELNHAAVAVCKMLGKRQKRDEADREEYTEAEPVDAETGGNSYAARAIAVEAHKERESKADTHDMLNTEATRLGITTEEPTKRRRRIKRGSVAEKIQREEADTLEAVVMRILETPGRKARRTKQSDFDRVEPPAPLWDADSTERGLLQLEQERAARADNAGRVVPFVPEDAAWWKLLVGRETSRGPMGGVTHEPATWPKLQTCVLAFAMRPEDVRKLVGAESLLGGGRGGCRVHPRGLQKVAEDFLKTLDHLEPAFDVDGSKATWHGNAKKLLKRLVRILGKV